MLRGIYAVIWLCKWASLLLVPFAFWYAHKTGENYLHSLPAAPCEPNLFVIHPSGARGVCGTKQQADEFGLLQLSYFPAGIPFLIMWQIQDVIKNRLITKSRTGALGEVG